MKLYRGEDLAPAVYERLNEMEDQLEDLKAQVSCLHTQLAELTEEKEGG